VKEIRGDIWDYHDKGKWVIITTNGFVKKNGEAVMGRGVAYQAKQKFPELPKKLGDRLLEARSKGSEFWNKPKVFKEFKIVTFPVKHNWWEKGNLDLIELSSKVLAAAFGFYEEVEPFNDVIYSPRPGCNNGKLDWKDVKPILEKYLDDKLIIVDRNVEND